MPKPSDSRNIRVMQFLDAYEKQESLWNPALESYKNKQSRDEAYLSIIRELKVPSLTINDVKLKVKSIRTTYTKELRTLTKHNEEGRTYNPKLFWFSRANSFLKSVSLARDRRPSIMEKQNATSEDFKSSCIIDFISDVHHRQNMCEDGIEKITSVVDDAQNTSCSTYEYKELNASSINSDIGHVKIPDNEIVGTSTLDKRLDNLNDDISNHVPNLGSCKYNDITPANSARLATLSIVNQQPISVNCDNVNYDEYDLFCKSVAMQLRSISDPYSRAVAKLKIQQILFEAETGHYENNSAVTVPISQNVNTLTT